MSNITKLFEDESTKAFNEIDDEALGQLGTELERIKAVQDKIETAETMIKKLKELKYIYTRVMCTPKLFYGPAVLRSRRSSLQVDDDNKSSPQVSVQTIVIDC